MEGPTPTTPAGEKSEPRRRRCRVCGDLFSADQVVSTLRGPMCKADYYRTATDNEDPDE